MRTQTFEKQIVKLGKLLSRKTLAPEKEGENQEQKAIISGEQPQIVEEETETIPKRGRTVRSIERLETHERKAIVRTLKRLKEVNCSFRTIKSGNLERCWITPPNSEKDSHVSIPHPTGFRKLLRRAGIKPR